MTVTPTPTTPGVRTRRAAAAEAEAEAAAATGATKGGRGARNANATANGSANAAAASGAAATKGGRGQRRNTANGSTNAGPYLFPALKPLLRLAARSLVLTWLAVVWLWHLTPAASVLPGASGYLWFCRYLTFYSFSLQLVGQALAFAHDAQRHRHHRRRQKHAANNKKHPPLLRRFWPPSRAGPTTWGAPCFALRTS